MKIAAYIYGGEITVNGASMLLMHHLHALKDMGAETVVYRYGQPIPDDVDWVIFQGEGYNIAQRELSRCRAKKICWIGHFKPHVRYGILDLQHIRADIYHTQWTGECVKYAEEELQSKLHYLPHAGCDCTKEGVREHAAPVVFVGNTYPERTQDWLTYAGVQPQRCATDKINNLYASALVCPNIHGDFQKNMVTDYMQVPGEMINDRIFQVILSGGFAISDNTPIVKEFFSADEVPYAETKEEFKELITHFVNHPLERLSYMRKAKEKILSHHLYKHRWKELSLLLGLAPVNI